MASSNLPVQLTSFIGRKSNLAELERLLCEARLITLTGTGGCGKTRLAVQIASTVKGGYEDGVWWVDLASISDSALVPQLIVHTFGLRPVADQPMMDMLIGFVRPKKLLLILDNCEHLIETCAGLALRLLAEAPELHILATSREVLAVPGEINFPVPGLTWPSDQGKLTNNLLDLNHYDAVRLFVERAQSVSHHFTLTIENSPAVVDICRRLDGLPLALELASARINVLTVQEIAARLDDRFSLLTSGQRAGLEPRHHTLRATIDWSYELLTDEERAFLQRLAVFTAGCTLDTAQAVCGGMELWRSILLIYFRHWWINHWSSQKPPDARRCATACSKPSEITRWRN